MSGDIDNEFVPEEEAENPTLALQRLRERLKKAEVERGEYLEGWQRSKADFVNFKKEEEARRGHTEERIRASLAEEFIPVLDSFEMAAKHAQNKEFEILHKQLFDVMRKVGVERYGEAGESFNPHRHEAVREVAVESKEKDHTVVSVERSGYSIGTHVIRPAQVSVGTFEQK